MSLDIRLITEEKHKVDHSGIYIRENGHTLEISEEDWKRRFPNREPVRLAMPETETDTVYDANITHNMTKMADKAGVYYACWRPEEKGWKRAKDIIKVLRGGLQELKDKPNYFKQFNPDNGWGSYEYLVEFVEKYLEACEQYPDAEIEVSR